MSSIDLASSEPTKTGTAPSPPAAAGSAWDKALLAVYLAAVGIGLIYFLVRLWPVPDGNSEAWSKEVVVFWRDTPITGVQDAVRLLLLACVAGGLGSFLHAATSFVDYVGNRTFVRSWMLWYLLRPLIGGALALVLYVAVRGGLLTAAATTTGPPTVSPYGVAALGFLAGMFSKQATDKLNEVFTTMFRTSDGDAARKDKLHEGLQISGIEPAKLSVGKGDAELVVNGSGFEATSVARINGQARETTFVSPSQLKVKVTAQDVASPGKLELVIENASGKSSPQAVAIE